MKTNLISSFVFLAGILLLAVPQVTSAQRFNHASSGGGASRVSAPVSHAAQPAPVVRQQAPAPAPQQSRPTINGGSRNIGNHDFNARPEVRENVTVDVHQDYNVRQQPHENINVYHTGSYHGLHPYTYHPYHPFYWGPRWHPLGFFLNAMVANAFRFSIGNQWYYYADGCYYAPYNGGYTVINSPIGAIVNYLPDGYETVPVGNDYYYYYGGTFYIGLNGNRFQVVTAPLGAVVSQLPVGAAEQVINGVNLLVYNNTYYEPISQNGQDAYEVVPAY